MNNAQRTKKFLQEFSRRLSGREDCKQVEYMVGIGHLIEPQKEGDIIIPQSFVDSLIFFEPSNIKAYRDAHHRKDIDKFRVPDLIIKKHFPELIQDVDQFGQCWIDTSKLVKGVYKYELSSNGKRRRWIKLKSIVNDDRAPHSFVQL